MKTTKPAGGGICPPNVHHAQEIEDLICERGATCDLDDSKFNDVEEADAHSAITVSSDDNNPPVVSNPLKLQLLVQFIQRPLYIIVVLPIWTLFPTSPTHSHLKHSDHPRMSKQHVRFKTHSLWH